MSPTTDQLRALAANTIEQRGHLLATTVLGNLFRLAQQPGCFYELIPETTKDGRAIICGAGPSLDGALDAMRRARVDRSNADVYAVSACAARVRAALPSCDVISVAMEPMPVHSAPSSCCDLQAHPNAWGPGSAWLLSPDMAGHHIASGLDLPVLESGGSTLTAAVAMAYRLGYKTIVLAGVDLVLCDGPVYAAGCMWDGITARSDGGRVILEGRKDRDAMHSQYTGVETPREIARPIMLPLARGGVAPTTLDYAQQWQWLASLANREPGQRWLITTGSTYIDGWDIGGDVFSAPAQERRITHLCGCSVPRERLAKWLDGEIDLARRHAAASEATAPRGRLPDVDARTMLASSPFVDMMLGGVVEPTKRRVKAGEMSAGEAFDVLRAATAEACAQVVDLLDQQRELVELVA